ncbi:MAG TPA: dTMP kinase [Syntrophomonadaceae bacterium]|nr:dTMP kinase [Syntrophomonadaceae bacterium]HQA06995.1 dTMP kinase [Syntrophomonadaceae bacterium]HQE23870.1 dTMP kinase [Syntrophomonadaceae bacterium]
MLKGIFISLEGVDGSGKTSLKEELLGHLAVFDPLSLREPGGTPISEKIRNLLLDTSNEDMQARTEAFLYASARCQLVETVIRPALQQGKMVIADRYIDSTLAYQGFGRGLPLDFLEQLNQLSTGGLRPDLTLLLDLDPTEGARRRAQDAPDRLEKAGLLFQNRVRQGYLQIARQEPQRICVIDAHQPLEMVVKNALQEIQQLLTKRGWYHPRA